MRAKGNQGPTPARPNRLVIAGRRCSRADQVPPDRRGKYGLTTNHGTSEHILDQRNTFNAIHDFTARGGLMLHALPFTVHLEHGFFSYQPNLFDALARYNSYQTLGTWVGPDWSPSSLVPWEPRLLEFLTLNAKTTRISWSGCSASCTTPSSAFRLRVRAHAAGKCQGSLPARRRWGILQRPESLPGADAKKELSLPHIPAAELARHLGRRIVRRVKRNLRLAS
jgi:hypothetical protein